MTNNDDCTVPGPTLRTAEQVRRLRVLRDFFRDFNVSHQPEQFCIDLFARPHSCGTMACVAGWAGLIPEFHRLGLETNLNSNMVKLFLKKGTDGRVEYEIGSDAIARFFGLTDDERYDLCFATGYLRHPVTTEMVVAKLEEYLANTQVINP